MPTHALACSMTNEIWPGLFRRAMLLSRGDLSVFLTRPIAAWTIGACPLLVAAQLCSYARRVRLIMPPVAEKASG
jgi:TctA family transporter